MFLTCDLRTFTQCLESPYDSPDFSLELTLLLKAAKLDVLPELRALLLARLRHG